MLKWFQRKSEPELQAIERESARDLAPVSSPDRAVPSAGLAPAEQTGFLSRLKQGLSKTSDALGGKLRAAIGLKEKIDEDLLDSIEEVLVQSDVGSGAAAEIVDRIRAEGVLAGENVPDRIIALVQNAMAEILSEGNRTLDLWRAKPLIFLIVGVNGTGKTTTIGKLALQLNRAGHRVLLVAADTFRAGAIEQLGIWAQRTGSGIVRRDEGSDPAAVCYEALEEAKKDPPDFILIDTAGRLHTKTHLMNELGRIIRVIKKIYPDAPHETILVLDATTGQNALNQVATFKEVSDLTGLIMTKLDGTAKGGILVAIKNAHKLPIFKIGIGEAPQDLRDFNPKEFAEAIFSRNGRA